MRKPTKPSRSERAKKKERRAPELVLMSPQDANPWRSYPKVPTCQKR